MKTAIKIILAELIIIAVALLVFPDNDTPAEPSIRIDTVYTSDELSEWEILQLAITEVESSYDTLAVSHKGARGALQITNICLKDVNRIKNTSYTMEDVENYDTSLDCWDTMQSHYNPSKEILAAISLWNPRGGVDYQILVTNTMERIYRQEFYRYRIVNRRNCTTPSDTYTYVID